MNKDFRERMATLEELAGKATQGEWKANTNDYGSLVASFDGDELALIIEPIEKADAEYMAAANPAMIKEMIAVIRKMWRQNNWDVAALQAYGALPEDMEVHIENESFAWHLNRIKTGIGKRLEFAEKRLDDCLLQNERLEKESDWLAYRLKEFCEPSNNDPQCCYLRRRYCNGVRTDEWREAARNAIKRLSND